MVVAADEGNFGATVALAADWRGGWRALAGRRRGHFDSAFAWPGLPLEEYRPDTNAATNRAQNAPLCPVVLGCAQVPMRPELSSDECTSRHIMDNSWQAAVLSTPPAGT